VNRLAIFDCDGTLVDSQHNICLAMERCFAAAGLEPPAREHTRTVVGLSLIEAMRAMLPDAAHDDHVALAESYKRAFQAMRAEGLADEPLYEGVAELVDRLEADGWLLGIATGKSDRGVALVLEHHGLAGRFVTIQTADRHPSKPHPSMIEQALAEAGAAAWASLMIGDTSYDMAMARAAGVTAVGVAWGYHSPDELVRAGAHHVAAHPRDILELVQRFPQKWTPVLRSGSASSKGSMA
jgi:phosphoglycolate phosphatase